MNVIYYFAGDVNGADAADVDGDVDAQTTQH